jgi:hypothetical protein
VNDDWKDVGRILREEWPALATALLLKALAKHPQRDLIRELRRERDERGVRRWSLRRLVEDDVEDPWVEVWLLPHPSDWPPIKVGTWPLRLEAPVFADAEAVIDEHRDSPR